MSARGLRWLIALILAIGALAQVSGAGAATTIVLIETTFTGAGDRTSWSDGANWDNGVPRSFRDNVPEPDVIGMYLAVIPAGFAVVVTSPTLSVVQRLTVEAGGSLTTTIGSGQIQALGSLEFTSEADGGTEGDAVIDGDLILNGVTLLTHGIRVDGSLTMRTSGRLRIEGDGTRTLAGTGEIVFDHAGASLVPEIGSNSPDGELVIPASMTIRGGSGNIASVVGSSGATNGFRLDGTILADRPGESISIGNGPGTQTFINNGAVVADGGRFLIRAEIVVNASPITVINGGTLEIDDDINVGPQTFTNNSSIAATDGTLILDGTWTNNASIDVTNTAVFLEGSFTTAGFESIARVNSPVELDGEMDNSGDTYTVDQSNGLVVLDAGVIIGGVVDATGETLRAERNAQSTLRDVVYRGVLDLSKGVTTINGVQIENTITFDPATTNTVFLAAAELHFIGGGELRLDGVADIIIDPTRTTSANPGGIASAVVGSNLTIEPGISISGVQGYIHPVGFNSTITLRGSVVSTGNVGGSSITLGSGSGISTVVNQGSLTADGAGVLTFFGEVVTNRGTIAATGGGKIVHTDINSTAAVPDVTLVNEAGATLTIGAGSVFQLQDGLSSRSVLLVNRGALVVDGEITTLGAQPPVANEGLLTGTGAIRTTLNNSGTIAPGASSGGLTIDGDLNLDPSSAIDVDVDGPTPVTQHDQIVVGGNAAIDGAINIAIDPGYLPADEETVTVITAAGGTGVLGTFAVVNSAVTSNGRVFFPDYLPSAVNLVAGLPVVVVAVSEAVSVTDAVGVVALPTTVVIAISESVSVTDAVDVTVVAPPAPVVIAISEGVTVADALGVMLGAPPSEVIAISEAVSVTDAVGVTVVALPAPVVIAISEAVSVTDNVGVTVVAPPALVVIAISETVSVSDDVALTANSVPVAVDDAASTTTSDSLTIAVLVNDSDPDGDPLTIVDVTDGTNGGVVDNGDGTVTYTRNPGFNGTDDFTYTIGDGRGGAATALVAVTVTPDIMLGDDVVLGSGVTIEAGAQLKDGAAIGDGAMIGEDARIGKDAVVGSGATVENDARLEGGASLGDGSTLEPGAVLQRGAAVGTGTVVGSDSVVERGAVVGNDVQIGSDVRVERGAVIGDRVSIDDQTTIKSGATIGDDTSIGADTLIERDAQVGAGVTIGSSVRVKKGAVVPDGTVVPDGSTVG